MRRPESVGRLSICGNHSGARTKLWNIYDFCHVRRNGFHLTCDKADNGSPPKRSVEPRATIAVELLTQHSGRVITFVALAPLQLGQAIRLTQDPRAPWPSRGRQAGADFAKSCFALGPKAELNLGLCTRLPMPSGRQLATSRWRHVCGHPPASLTTFWIWGRLSTRSRNFRGRNHD